MRRSDESVMIVEDEPVSRSALATLLSGEGYQTEACESAEEALTRAHHGRIPRLALVDLNLPGMSGIDLLERLERLCPDLCAVLITAARDDEIDRFCRDHWVAYMRKPADFPRLLSLLAQIEARAHGPRSSSIQSKPERFGPNRRTGA